MMAREGLTVDSQTLWDQLHAIARHLQPSYQALGRQVTGIDPQAYLLRALYMAIAHPGTVTVPSGLVVSTPATWRRTAYHAPPPSQAARYTR